MEREKEREMKGGKDRRREGGERNKWKDVCMYVWMDGWMDEWTDGHWGGEMGEKTEVWSSSKELTFTCPRSSRQGVCLISG